MNRILVSLIALLSATMPLLLDSALKGAALLGLAAVGASGLWKASAATRHLVWLVAVVALLVLPVLSAALPQWRVLPKWTAGVLADGVAPAAKIANQPSASDEPHESPPLPTLDTANAGPAPTVPFPPRATSHVSLPTSHQLTLTWRNSVSVAWAAVSTLLVARILAAHLLLCRAARRCVILAPAVSGTSNPITAAFAAARAQLGIRQQVTLLLDENRMMPVVWGVLRPRLLLPAEAREWSHEQLLSVLLHELAHVRRRDALVQWLTQVACALHWFNPLVWLAAWRLHAERERACDDLVLASGVRASAYAEHLLHIATKLSPARWTQACGLAIARKSSLEGRLLAVLSCGRNRGGVTGILVTAAVLLAAAIAIPLAMLRAAQPDKPEAEAPAVKAEPKDPTSKAVQEPLKPAATAAEKPMGAAAKLTPDGLLGFWRGERNGDAISISFHRPPADADVQCDIYFGEATIGALMTSTIAPDGKSVTLMGRGEGGGEYGRLTPGEGGTLELEVTDKKARPGKVTLTREADEAANEPRQKEARGLFEMWKIAANADGTIPGTFIGMLAAEVRAYVKENPNLDSGMKLAKLLPRFVTSRDWTAAEAIKLLDDVAHYSTAPIEARMLLKELGALKETGLTPAGVPLTTAQDDDAGVPLETAVRKLNEEAAADPIGKTQPPLTEDAVIAAIRGPDPRDPAAVVRAMVPRNRLGCRC